MTHLKSTQSTFRLISMLCLLLCLGCDESEREAAQTIDQALLEDFNAEFDQETHVLGGIGGEGTSEEDADLGAMNSGDGRAVVDMLFSDLPLITPPRRGDGH